MPKSPLQMVLQRLAPSRKEQTDGELLTLFLRDHDNAALNVLIERHASLVWGVCHRILRHHDDALDAFQATFLVLIRKAATVSPREMLASWLHGVARQTSIRLRATRAKQGWREMQKTQFPHPEFEMPDDELLTLLDRELDRLPERLRTVIVLCELEGRTRKEVARQLGCPEGTVASRLVRARALLAKRFANRGITLSAGTLAVVFARGATSSASLSAVEATLRMATTVVTGEGGVPPHVATLAEGVQKALFISKLQGLTTVLVASLLVGLIGFQVVPAQPKEQPPKSELAPKVEEAVKENPSPYALGDVIDGLQLGLATVPMGMKSVQHGESIKFQINLRNVSKADITITYGLPKEFAPVVTSEGKGVKVFMPSSPRYYLPPKDHLIKAGETIGL
jgi:RNA polymerase sigma factor (sigma-70 family)